MKKILVTVLAFAGIIFPLTAQVAPDYLNSDIIPVESLTLKKDQVPPAIAKAVSTDFKTGQPLTWSKFPYALKNYRWTLVPASESEKPNLYEVEIKTNEGNVFAIYKPDGTILQSRLSFTNAPLPETVITALEKSQFRDWKIVGDKELIDYNKDKGNVLEHFRIYVKKDNMKHSISFNFKEPAS